MSDNQTYNVKVIKNKLRDLYYHIQYIGNQPLEVGETVRKPGWVFIRIELSLIHSYECSI